jgi:hypothetical protein
MRVTLETREGDQFEVMESLSLEFLPAKMRTQKGLFVKVGNRRSGFVPNTSIKLVWEEKK